MFTKLLLFLQLIARNAEGTEHCGLKKKTACPCASEGHLYKNVGSYLSLTGVPGIRKYDRKWVNKTGTQDKKDQSQTKRYILNVHTE